MFQYRSKSFENKKTQTSINYSFPPSDFTLPDSNLRINEQFNETAENKVVSITPLSPIHNQRINNCINNPPPPP